MGALLLPYVKALIYLPHEQIAYIPLKILNSGGILVGNKKIKRAENLENLPFDLKDMKIKEDPRLLPGEKEITVNIINNKVNIFASNRTAMSYIKDRIAEDAAELNWLYYCDENIYTIDADLPNSYLTFKGKPRQDDNLSSIFN